MHIGCTSSTIHYYWGKDLSGTLQSAGGVGVLLYLTIDNALYIPCYDANGNITRYLDANGNTVAQYTYDAFGNTTSATGTLASIFRHRFSTKYFDTETGLYYYGYRFYHPTLMRWLTRDPIEEEGGMNLYAFCLNAPVKKFDMRGQNIYLYTGNDSGNWLNDRMYQSVAVDVWASKGKRARKSGRTSFTFAYNGDWRWYAPAFSWLGFDGFVFPGFYMEGVIEERCPPVGYVVAEKKTTCAQDRKWLKQMRERVDSKDVYSVGRHNCRNFSQTEFDKAPGKKIR